MPNLTTDEDDDGLGFFRGLPYFIVFGLLLWTLIILGVLLLIPKAEASHDGGGDESSVNYEASRDPSRTYRRNEGYDPEGSKRGKYDPRCGYYVTCTTDGQRYTPVAAEQQMNKGSDGNDR